MIGLEQLASLCGLLRWENFTPRIDAGPAMAFAQRNQREQRWSQSLAVGGKAFMEKVQQGLGIRGRHREIDEDDATQRNARANAVLR
jgi:hypothetical protein